MLRRPETNGVSVSIVQLCTRGQRVPRLCIIGEGQRDKGETQRTNDYPAFDTLCDVFREICECVRPFATVCVRIRTVGRSLFSAKVEPSWV